VRKRRVAVYADVGAGIFSKDDVNYRPSNGWTNKRCGKCTNFDGRNKSCDIVVGSINLWDTCDLFEYAGMMSQGLILVPGGLVDETTGNVITGESGGGAITPE
jgi:hypothetical protein